MLRNIKHLILDMDGVLWHGDTPLPGFAEFFSTLDDLGITFVLATNNATKIATQYQAKLARLGATVTARQILTSAEATADFLSQQYPAGTAVFIIGEDGLHQSLTAKGFNPLTPKAVYEGQTAPLVVLGFTRHVIYNDLAMGALLVNNGARFIGTNPDPSFPSEIGRLPGAGALMAVISTATGVQPTIVGKPEPVIFQTAMQRLGGLPHNTAMVGDRLTTDILGGQRAGIGTILLMSGVTDPATLAASDIQPDLTFSGIDTLAVALRQAVLQKE